MRSLVVLVGVLMFGCGNSSSGGDDGPGPDAGVSYICAVVFSSNHGHTFEVPSGDIANPQDRTYTTMGNASHTHQFSVTAAQFTRLQSITSEVHTTTTFDAGHMHDVSMTCTH